MAEPARRLSRVATGGETGIALEAFPPPSGGMRSRIARFADRHLTSSPKAACTIRPAASGQRPAASGQRPAASGMTCARRLAGARMPAPSTPAGSSRPDACVGRRRARFSLLPALALLLGALSLFAPAQAQAKVTIWSGTLTVRDVENANNWHGCLDKNNLGTAQACNPDGGGSLTSNAFTYRGTTYTINVIRHIPTTKSLEFGFTTTVPDTDWVLVIGDEHYVLNDWHRLSSPSTGAVHIRGSNPNLLSWTVGQQVQLSLLAPTTLSLRTDSSNNQVTEGQTLTVTGTLDDGTVRDHTPVTVLAHSPASAPDVTVTLGSYTITETDRHGRITNRDKYYGHIQKGRDTFQIKLHAVDDNLAEVSPEPVTVTVMVDLDRDTIDDPATINVDEGRYGTYEMEEAIEIGVVDNETNAIAMTASSTTLEEGGEYVTVTLTVQNPEALATAPSEGHAVPDTMVRVTAAGTASVSDYDMRPSQWEHYVEDGENRSRRAAYFRFKPAVDQTPAVVEHTLRLRANPDNVDEETETVILTAEDVNNPGLRGTLTLTIPGRDSDNARLRNLQMNSGN